jgi:hypothetical protein
VNFGKSVKVTAHLLDHLDTTSKELSISATPYGGGKKLIASGNVNGDGNLIVAYTPTKKTTFVATFAYDGTYETATSDPKVVGVAVRITGKLTHGSIPGRGSSRSTATRRRAPSTTGGVQRTP